MTNTKQNIERTKFAHWMQGTVMAFVLFCAYVFVPSQAYAACINPPGVRGQQVYNGTHKVMQFCDGSVWVSMAAGLSSTIGDLTCADTEVVYWHTGDSEWKCGPDQGMDNLGNHTATQDIDAATNDIVNVGLMEFENVTGAAAPRGAVGGGSGGSGTSGCYLPWGGSVPHGIDVTAYRYAASTCTSTETRTCSNGSLSGTYANASCSDTAGEASFTTVGGHGWTVPAGVTSVSAVCIGGGGAGNDSGGGSGGGGGLRYRNNISVTPGDVISITVGAGGNSSYHSYGEAGGDSLFGSFLTAGGGNGASGAGTGAGGGGSPIGGDIGGGDGGRGGSGNNSFGKGGGGGAGGYSGDGGDGAAYNVAVSTAGNGGGGGGAAGYNGGGNGYAGGGVGLLGEGASGASGSATNGLPGSGGSGMLYGGGTNEATGGHGACRVIWPGDTRQFPSTQAGTFDPTNCSLPWGGIIADGANVTAYQSATSSCGTTETRTCSDGTLSGSYQYDSCSIPLDVASVFSTDLSSGANPITVTNGLDMSGVGGLTWLKRRDAGSTAYHALFDSETGYGTVLQANTSSSALAAGGIYTPSSNGFSSLPPTSPGNYVAWSFLEAPRFFDIVTYTGNGINNHEIPHNLGIEPGLVIIKKTSTSGDWNVWHRSLDSATYNNAMFLNKTDARTFNDLGILGLAQTSSHLVVSSSPGTLLNESGTQYVAYLFAHDDSAGGGIQCGNYTGNGSATGPTVNLGWQPQWLMIKNASATENWSIWDNQRSTSNPRERVLEVNNTNAEGSSSSYRLDFTSTGFQPKTTHGVFNTSGATYIYCAIREE